MARNQNELKFKKKIYEIISDFSYDFSPPVIKIANLYGLKVVSTDLSEYGNDVAGFYDAKNKTIGVSENDLSVRQRFTIAHELAHFFLDHKLEDGGELLYRKDLNESLDPQEIEANYFAAMMLMPEEEVKKALNIYVVDLNSYSDIRELAKLFNVSFSAMKYRLMNLNYIKEEVFR